MKTIFNTRNKSLFNRWIVLLMCIMLSPYSLWGEIYAYEDEGVYIENGKIIGPVDKDVTTIYLDQSFYYRNNHITSIAPGAFKDCKNLTSFHYTIPPRDRGVSIGASAFEGCTNLQECYIPRNVESIGENAFEGCI